MGSKSSWKCVAENRQFAEQISSEYSCLLNTWLKSRNSPGELNALKSFVRYLEDAKKLCHSKGKGFEDWFSETIADDEYISKRKRDIDLLIRNKDKNDYIWEMKQTELPQLEEKLLKMISENEGILQSELIRQFDPYIQDFAREKLYYMAKEGKVKRTKKGSSYILTI